VERRIKRSFLDAKKIDGLFVDMSGQSVTVHRSFGLESFEDQQRERALQDVVFLAAHT
jgi:hypothetical protein